MDYIAPDCIWPDSLKLKLLKDGFVSSSEILIQVYLVFYIYIYLYRMQIHSIE